MSKEAIKTGRYTYLKRTEDTKELRRLQDLSLALGTGGFDPASLSLGSSRSSSSSSVEDTTELYSTSCNSIMEVDSTTQEDLDQVTLSKGDPTTSTSHMSPSHFFNLDSRTNQQTSSLALEDWRAFPKMKSSSRNLSNSQTLKPKTSIPHHVIRANQSNLSEGFQIKMGDEISYNLPESVRVKPKVDPYSLDADSSYENQFVNFNRTPARDCNQTSYKPLRYDQHGYGEANQANIKPLSFQHDNDSECCRQYTDLTPCSLDSASSLQREVYFSDPHGNFPNLSLITDSAKIVSLQQNPICELTSLKQETPTSDYDAVQNSYILNSQLPSSISQGIATPFTSPGRGQDEGSGSTEEEGGVVLNIDSGQLIKVENSCSSPAHTLCEYDARATSPSGSESEKSMYLRRQQHPQKLSAVETLLTSPSPTSPRSTKSTSPLPSPQLDVTQSSPAASPGTHGVSLANVHELFVNKDDVISAMVESHNENVGDFMKMSKEEMIRQQQAHYEACKLKNKTFGSLEFLPEKEYDEIYSVTGMDVDNRRRMIDNFLLKMESCVRCLVQFAKSIPGFTNLDLNTQVDLIKSSRSEFAMLTTYRTVNLQLGVSLGLCGLWTCTYDVGRIGSHVAISEYMKFSDSLQKLDPSHEEVVLLKAIIVMSTDREGTIQSPLADAIRWELCECLLHVLQNRLENPSKQLARYILALTQVRTVSEDFKGFLKSLKLDKYSTIEQNPLMYEVYSPILHAHDGQDGVHEATQENVAEKETYASSFLGCAISGQS
ncbi:uncharacterized protein LOC131928420 isoform X2 [Physella acuta]|nr:uncharacterized protein LOC131928420 isoform X2 [Physella acuta]